MARGEATDYEAALEQLALLERAAKGPSFGGRRQALQDVVERCERAYERCRSSIDHTATSPDAIAADPELADCHKRELLEDWRRTLLLSTAGAASGVDSAALPGLLRQVEAALAALDDQGERQTILPQPRQPVRRRRR